MNTRQKRKGPACAKTHVKTSIQLIRVSGGGWGLGVMQVGSGHMSRKRRDLKARLERVTLTYLWEDEELLKSRSLA